MKTTQNNYEEKKEILEEMVKNSVLKQEEYASCNHILVKFNYHYDGVETDYCKGCIKCGLHNAVLEEPKDSLSLTEKIMRDYLEHTSFGLEGIHLNIYCDFRQARKVYAKIQETYPTIEDELVIQSFLEAIKNPQFVEEDEFERASRLALEQVKKRKRI